jgi:hypothetical protein
MADIASIGGAISSVKAAVEIARGVHQIANDLNSAELVQRIIDLQSTLIEVQSKIMDMREEVEQLRSANMSLKGRLNARAELKYDPSDGLYRHAEAIEGDTSRYCPRCFESQPGSIQRLIAKNGLAAEHGLSNVFDVWKCAGCKQYYRRDPQSAKSSSN